jgi:hypothetical protein
MMFGNYIEIARNSVSLPIKGVYSYTFTSAMYDMNRSHICGTHENMLQSGTCEWYNSLINNLSFCFSFEDFTEWLEDLLT